LNQARDLTALKVAVEMTATICLSQPGACEIATEQLVDEWKYDGVGDPGQLAEI
jgi:hypothetical protein